MTRADGGKCRTFRYHLENLRDDLLDWLEVLGWAALGVAIAAIPVAGVVTIAWYVFWWVVVGAV